MINLGIIGLGKWGRRHAESAIASGRFKVIRAVSKEPREVEQFARDRSISLGTEIEEILADEMIQAISLATPHTQHVSQIIMAAGAGKHVLTEKPFALTTEGAERAVAACRQAGVCLAVGQDNRFYPAIVELGRLLSVNAIGKLLHVEANLCHDAMKNIFGSLETPHGAMPNPAQGTQSTSWRLASDEAPAGSFVHLGVHRLDTFVQFFGEVQTVYVQAAPRFLDTPFADSVSALFKFRSGMTGFLASSLATPLNSRLQVFGSEGSIELTGPSDMPTYLRSSLTKVSLRTAKGDLQTRDHGTADSVRLNFERFADAIEGKHAYPISPNEMIHVASLLEAINHSLQSGQAVAVK